MKHHINLEFRTGLKCSGSVIDPKTGTHSGAEVTFLDGQSYEGCEKGMLKCKTGQGENGTYMLSVDHLCCSALHQTKLQQH